MKAIKKNPNTPHLRLRDGWWTCECRTTSGVGSTPLAAHQNWYAWRVYNGGK